MRELSLRNNCQTLIFVTPRPLGTPLEEGNVEFLRFSRGVVEDRGVTWNKRIYNYCTADFYWYYQNQHIKKGKAYAALPYLFISKWLISSADQKLQLSSQQSFELACLLSDDARSCELIYHL